MNPDDEAWPSGTRTAQSPRPGARVWGVQSLLLAVADTLASRLGAVAVEGDLTGFTRAGSGHCYFGLEDARGQATLRCAMFRRAASMLGFAPRDGLRVVVRGRLSVYDARGELQLIVESMALAGEGALYERFLRLKAGLEAQGLFDPSRKRALPTHVWRVGVVTSLAAAALHDVATALARRAPHVDVVVYPSLVQGADAPAALVQALETAARRAEVDVVLVVRGGGSLEDLWCFNDERLVRAIVASQMPVVVGVGHESDVTLADLAADLRAATPTAAAELAVPLRASLLDALHVRAQRIARAMRRRLEQEAVRVDRAALLLARPARVLEAQRRRLAQVEARLPAVVRQALRSREVRLQQLRGRVELSGARRCSGLRQGLESRAARLDALDPRRVLLRGYAWITDEQGRPIDSVRRVASGDSVQAVLADGRIEARVESVHPDADPRAKASDKAIRTVAPDKADDRQG